MFPEQTTLYQPDTGNAQKLQIMPPPEESQIEQELEAALLEHLAQGYNDLPPSKNTGFKIHHTALEDEYSIVSHPRGGISLFLEGRIIPKSQVLSILGKLYFRQKREEFRSDDKRHDHLILYSYDNMNDAYTPAMALTTEGILKIFIELYIQKIQLERINARRTPTLRRFPAAI